MPLEKTRSSTSVGLTRKSLHLMKVLVRATNQRYPSSSRYTVSPLWRTGSSPMTSCRCGLGLNFSAVASGARKYPSLIRLRLRCSSSPCSPGPHTPRSGSTTKSSTLGSGIPIDPSFRSKSSGGR